MDRLRREHNRRVLDQSLDIRWPIECFIVDEDITNGPLLDNVSEMEHCIPRRALTWICESYHVPWTCEDPRAPCQHHPRNQSLFYRTPPSRHMFHAGSCNQLKGSSHNEDTSHQERKPATHLHRDLELSGQF